jgi:hypothetical protein
MTERSQEREVRRARHGSSLDPSDVWPYLGGYGHTEDQGYILAGHRNGPAARAAGSQVGRLEIRGAPASRSRVGRRGAGVESCYRPGRPLASLARPHGGGRSSLGAPRARGAAGELAEARLLARCDPPRHEFPDQGRRARHPGRSYAAPLAQSQRNPACVVGRLGGVPLRASVAAGCGGYGRIARRAGPVRCARRDAGGSVVQCDRAPARLPSGLYDRCGGDPVQRIARYEQRDRFSPVRRSWIDHRDALARGLPLGRWP